MRCVTLTSSYNNVQQKPQENVPDRSPFEVIIEPLCDFPKVTLVTLSLLVIDQNV